MTTHYQRLDRADRIMNVHGLSHNHPQSRGAIRDLIVSAIESNPDADDRTIARFVREWLR